MTRISAFIAAFVTLLLVKAYLACVIQQFGRQSSNNIIPLSKVVEGEPAKIPIGIALEMDDSTCSKLALGVPCDASDEEKNMVAV